jgi:hypothetical protein
MSLPIEASRSCLPASLVVFALLQAAVPAQAEDRPVYRCPGNQYTDQISAREAQERGCKTLEGATVTVIQGPRRPAPRASGTGEAGTGAKGDGTAKVDAAEQRARDSDARRILEAELRKEEGRLAALQRDFAGGNPERRGDERNFAIYQERVAEMKAAIARKEADIAAIKRELAKLATP